ncbi:MAG: hypothetical protein ACRDDP_06300 [Plesiomonas sp.]
MTTHTQVPVRYPKEWFALTIVYSFTGAAILASIIFSLLLFLSIDDNPMMKWLFGALAVIFELGKFYVWYEFGERRSRRDLSGALSALFFYTILAMISIGGSIGGINSATNTALNVEAQHQREVARYDEQIASIDRQIQLNETAAMKYIELDRISRGVKSMQDANSALRLQQDALRQERDAQPVSEQSSMLGLMSSLAEGMHLSTSQVQFVLVCFLSLLLDVFAAFFVGLIGEESRFRRKWAAEQRMLLKPVAEPEVQEASIVAEPEVEAITLSPFERVREGLLAGHVKCSKKHVAQHLQLPVEQVDSIFQQLVSEGVLGQRPNRHYHLCDTL